MPLMRCGKNGWKWGKSGKCYVGPNARARALRQMRAIKATGWTENVFCPTGEGGGVDPTCSPSGKELGHIDDIDDQFHDRVLLPLHNRNNVAPLLRYSEKFPERFSKIRMISLRSMRDDSGTDLSMPEFVRGGSIVAYRGVTTEGDPVGRSWTLSKKVAEAFSKHGAELGFRATEGSTGGSVVEKRIRVSDVLFYSDEQGEKEIILKTPVANAAPKKSTAGLLRTDPTRTTTLRRSFSEQLTKRFNQLKRDLVDLLIKEDAFGLIDKPFTFNVEEGVWRTIRGAKVFIEGGRITKGPDDLVGRDITPASKFASMPVEKATSKEAKKWRKEMQETYDNDPEFRALVDSVSLYTQGDYNVQRAFAERAVTGNLPPEYLDSALPNWVDRPLHGNALAKYKTYFEGQGDWHDDKGTFPKATYTEAGEALSRAVHQSPKMDTPLYRGVVGRDFIDKAAKLKSGDDFDILGPSSFTVDSDVGLEFSEGQAKGQGGRRGDRAQFRTLITVEPGARALPVSALSPWDQKEVLTSGKFKVKGVKILEKSRYADDLIYSLELTLEQQHTWDIDAKQVRNTAGDAPRREADVVKKAFLRDSPFSPWLELTFNANYSSTQIDVDRRWIVDRIMHIQRRLDDRDVVKVENDPHVTVRYGLHAQQPNKVGELVKKWGSITLKLGKLSLFQNDDADVLKIGVSSNDLRKLHHKLGTIPNTKTQPRYSPHLTVAYLKPGTGKKYLDVLTGLEGVELSADALVFSDKNRKHYDVTLNTRWKFRTSDEKVDEFRKWLARQIKYRVIGNTQDEINENWWNQYVMDGYLKGAGRSFDDVHRSLSITQAPQIYLGGKRQFIGDMITGPVSTSKVKLLVGRVLTDLEGITKAMETQIIRELSDGLVRGQHPRQIAKNIANRVDKIGISRARTLAQTEIIRAHAEGQLDALERSGITHVGVAVEWSTAQDNRVCKLCRPLFGIVLTVKEAHGLIPRHPNCRCAFLPANVGEDRSKQIRTKRRIESAIMRSVAAERSKKSRRSVEYQRQRSRWAGAGVRIDSRRPKSILD